MLTSQAPIYVCSYYHLPNAESHSISQLQASLTKLFSYSNNPPHIICDLIPAFMDIQFLAFLCYVRICALSYNITL